MENMYWLIAVVGAVSVLVGAVNTLLSAIIKFLEGMLDIRKLWARCRSSGKRKKDGSHRRK